MARTLYWSSLGPCLSMPNSYCEWFVSGDTLSVCGISLSSGDGVADMSCVVLCATTLHSSVHFAVINE